MPWAPLAPTVGVGVVVAKFATIEKIKTIVGTYIFAGIKASNTRKQEHASSLNTLTETVRLHCPQQEGDDCMLEIIISYSAAAAILEARATSIGELNDYLGDYLSTAMESSKQRKHERTQGTSKDTDAIRVQNGCNGADSIMAVMIMFDMGIKILNEVYF
jgi:hypothetical protein